MSVDTSRNFFLTPSGMFSSVLRCLFPFKFMRIPTGPVNCEFFVLPYRYANLEPNCGVSVS